jgi:hypothetical protein
MPQNHNRTMTLSKMAYSDNPEVASSYSFQIYDYNHGNIVKYFTSKGAAKYDLLFNKPASVCWTKARG